MCFGLISSATWPLTAPTHCYLEKGLLSRTKREWGFCVHTWYNVSMMDICRNQVRFMYHIIVHLLWYPALEFVWWSMVRITFQGITLFGLSESSPHTAIGQSCMVTTPWEYDITLHFFFYLDQYDLFVKFLSIAGMVYEVIQSVSDIFYLYMRNWRTIFFSSN